MDERRQCVEEIRTLYELDMDNMTIREYIAKGLGNIWLKTHEEKKKIL